MAQAPSSTICLINFNNGIYDVTGQTTITNSGVTKSTDQVKFNTNSGYFNKDSNNIIQLSLPSEAGTISMWIYAVGSNTSGWYPTLFSSASSSEAGGTYIHVDDGGYSTNPVYRANSTSSSSNNGTYGSTVITRDAWHHVALCVNGSSHYYFLDGVLQATVTQTSHNDYTSWFIGGLRGGSSMVSGCYFNGYLGEILVTSDCLWTADFSVPIEAYTWDNEVEPPVEPITITSSSNYGTYSGSIANVTDGDTSTYWWTNSAQSASQFIRFNFSRPVTFNGLIAQTLNNTGDSISSGTVLQVSIDGSEWTTIGQFTGNATCTFADLNQKNVIAVRIYVETASNKWLCVNEITLDYIEETDQLYLRANGIWVAVNAVYKKVNGAWVLQDDLESLFDTNKKYVLMD